MYLFLSFLVECGCLLGIWTSCFHFSHHSCMPSFHPPISMWYRFINRAWQPRKSISFHQFVVSAAEEFRWLSSSIKEQFFEGLAPHHTRTSQSCLVQLWLLLTSLVLLPFTRILFCSWIQHLSCYFNGRALSFYHFDQEIWPTQNFKTRNKMHVDMNWA